MLFSLLVSGCLVEAHLGDDGGALLELVCVYRLVILWTWDLGYLLDSTRLSADWSLSCGEGDVDGLVVTDRFFEVVVV